MHHVTEMASESLEEKFKGNPNGSLKYFDLYEKKEHKQQYPNPKRSQKLNSEGATQYPLGYQNNEECIVTINRSFVRLSLRSSFGMKRCASILPESFSVFSISVFHYLLFLISIL